jgi:hypothetical protein
VYRSDAKSWWFFFVAWWWYGTLTGLLVFISHQVAMRIREYDGQIVNSGVGQ